MEFDFKSIDFEELKLSMKMHQNSTKILEVNIGARQQNLGY